MGNGRKYLSTKDVATLWHVSPSAVAKWIREGKLQAFTTPGGHYRVCDHDLARFAEQTGAPLPDFGLASTAHESWRILVVDDDPIVLEFIRDALGAAPEIYEVRTADTGYDVGAIVSTWEPHLLIIDLLMPGMNGFEVCEKLTESTWGEGPKILAVTGFGSADHLSRAQASGAHDCLTKPFTFAELLQKVRALLGVTTTVAPQDEVEERRADVRTSVCLPVRLSSLDAETMLAEGHSLDVSLRGVKAKISALDHDFGRIRTAIHLAQFGQWVHAEAACRWTAPGSDPDTTLILGLQLDIMSPEQSNLLQAAALFEHNRQGLASSSLRI